jgi:transcriptional regulator with XRE-family HTH domain
MSRPNFCLSLQREECGLRCHYSVAKSPKRPVFHPELGQKLADLRDARGWSVQEAVNYSQAKHPKVLTWNRLTRLESGKTKHPDADALRAVAEIYGLDYHQLASAYIAANYGAGLVGRTDADLVRHDDQVQQAPRAQEGEPDAQIAARVQQDRKVRHAKFAKEIRAAIARLGDVAAALVEDREIARPAPRRRGGDRKPRG